MENNEEDYFVGRLRLLSAMIENGDRIAWGTDSAAMSDAADVIEQLQAANAEMAELLDRAVEMTGEPECWHDHHGFCQAHNLEPKGECWVEQAKALIDGKKTNDRRD